MIKMSSSTVYTYDITLPEPRGLINVWCMACSGEQTFLVEKMWENYRSVIFMCRKCNRHLGALKFKKV